MENTVKINETYKSMTDDILHQCIAAIFLCFWHYCWFLNEHSLSKTIKNKAKLPLFW